MKKHKISAVILSAAMIMTLAACESNNSEQAESSSLQVSEESGTVQADTDTAAEETIDKGELPPETEGETEEVIEGSSEEISFFDCTVRELNDKDFILYYTNDNSYPVDNSSVGVIGDRTLKIRKTEYGSGYCYAGYSTTQLKNLSDGDREDIISSFDKLVGARNFYPIEPTNQYIAAFNTPYIISEGTPLIVFDKVTRTEGSFGMSHISAEGQEELLYAELWDTKFNAFVRKSLDDENVIEAIIDPAYMYGIPVFHRSASDCVYNINGTEIISDSAKVFMSYYLDDYEEGSETRSVLENLGEDYVYASLDASFSVCYSTKQGYISPTRLAETAGFKDSSFCSPGWVFGMKVLTENTDDAIETAYSITADLGTEADTVYNAIMANTGMIYKDNTIGIKLLDLDGDGTPELLVSNYVEDTNNEYAGSFDDDIDTDIYRIKNGSLVYIDTLYNPYLHYYDNGNVLGQKIADDGSVSWFTMSRLNRDTMKEGEVDYLFTLEGDKLKFSEIFREEDTVDENGEYTGTTYYYMGKPLEYTTKPGYNAYGYPDDIYCYGDIEADSGLFELFGYMQQDFANGLSRKYSLNTDWLISTDDQGNVVFAEPDDRTYCYGIAYMIDSFYAGINSDGKYNYTFLGDYEKPVIYLYPEEETEVSVKVSIKDGELTCTYPEYGDGWNVTAYPDGRLVNKADGREYSYLYWEGNGEVSWDMSEGFVVKGSDTAAFLQEKLAYMGLEPKEYNEFIVYWLPLMQDNEYNLIRFQTEQYEEMAKLDISPAPDSMLRIFMTFVPLDEEIDVPEQSLETFERKAFTVVEWGGAQLDEAE
ncbi:MAG: hypothetical protein ACI4JJ_05165 [Huintestinicola sp.]